MKAAIFCGSRECSGKDAKALAMHIMKRFLREESRSCVVIDGMARGADSVFYEASQAIAHGTGIALMNSRFPAKWEEYGKSAGYKRNQLMAQELAHYRSLGHETYVIGMVPGTVITKGTQHMVDIAKKQGFPVFIWSVELNGLLPT